MRPYAHTCTCRWTNAKKNTHLLWQKHRTPSEKKKLRTPKVLQRLYVFHLHAQRNHSLNENQKVYSWRAYIKFCTRPTTTCWKSQICWNVDMTTFSNLSCFPTRKKWKNRTDEQTNRQQIWFTGTLYYKGIGIFSRDATYGITHVGCDAIALAKLEWILPTPSLCMTKTSMDGGTDRMGAFDGGGKSTIKLELGEKGGAHVQSTMMMGSRRHNNSEAAAGWWRLACYVFEYFGTYFGCLPRK